MAGVPSAISRPIPQLRTLRPGLQHRVLRFKDDEFDATGLPPPELEDDYGARPPEARRGRQLRSRPLNTADGYGEKAEECRQQSEKAISPRDKAVWLRIAKSWLKMAQQLDQPPPKRKL
jgi:hypothetical protein